MPSVVIPPKTVTIKMTTAEASFLQCVLSRISGDMKGLRKHADSLAVKIVTAETKDKTQWPAINASKKQPSAGIIHFD